MLSLIILNMLWLHLSWHDIQSTGGLKIGTPHRNAKGAIFLPIECDISGTKTVTEKPVGINSGVVVRKVVAKIRKKQIHIWIVGTLAHGRYESAVCPEVKLGSIEPGEYEIFYNSPDNSEVSLGTTIILAPTSAVSK
ncbi:MAG: hypothetical protein K2X27_01485 [Candidatus Obscuribacterales bacterium]|nr:hypothetical protein [Candidatus Obscuribacterales bacterium]